MEIEVIFTLLLLCTQGGLLTTTDNEQTSTPLIPVYTENNDNTTTDTTNSTNISGPATEPPMDCSDTPDWSYLPFRNCSLRVGAVCKPAVSIPELMCICLNQCTLEIPTPAPPSEDFDCEDQQDWGKDGLGPCLDIIFDTCNLDMPRTEYMCVCEGLCNKTIEELNLRHAQNVADEQREQDKEHYIVKGVVYGIIFVLGLFGNLLVIVTVTKYMGKTTVTNIYICNLAVADLLVILICVPTKATESIYMIWRLGEPACKVILWLYFASFMWSVFTLLSMSLERYMVINHPMRAQKMSSLKRTAIIVVCIWILGILLSMPTVFLAEVHQDTVCTISGINFSQKRAFYIYIFVAIFFVPSILMSFAYIKTSITLWKSVKKQQQMKQSVDGKEDKSADTSGRVQIKDQKQKTKQVIRILIGVLVVFIVCWAPYLSVQIYNTTQHARTRTYLYLLGDLSLWFNFLSLANSALNPLLYGFLSRQFRMGFLRCLTCNRKGKEPAKSYITTSGGISTMTSRQTTVTTAIPMKPAAEATEKNGSIPNPAVNDTKDKL